MLQEKIPKDFPDFCVNPCGYFSFDIWTGVSTTASNFGIIIKKTSDFVSVKGG